MCHIDVIFLSLAVLVRCSKTSTSRFVYCCWAFHQLWSEGQHLCQQT